MGGLPRLIRAVGQTKGAATGRPFLLLQALGSFRLSRKAKEPTFAAWTWERIYSAKALAFLWERVYPAKALAE